MTNNFSVLFKKYSVPVLLLILGIALLIVGVTKDQGAMFMLSSVLMFVAGGLSLLYSSGKMKTLFLVIFGVLAGAAGIVMLSISWTQVSDEIATQERNGLLEKTAKQNLEDVIYIQKEYQEKNGVYASSWDEVTDFVMNGTVDYVFSEGSAPSRPMKREESKFLYNDNRPLDNNMSDVEAYLLSKWVENPNKADYAGFRRDTTQVSLYKTKFQSRSYLEARKLSGVGTFYPDSLRYIPMTKGKEVWLLEANDSLMASDSTFAPAIKVSGTLPFINKKMYFGSLTSPNELGGSWENE
ncbi:MAG: hypothetical protein P8P74_11310 [Crocinitomicaceae bacterium]|nr:hypothetical protein [Crocinitomicaceae bacterium]